MMPDQFRLPALEKFPRLRRWGIRLLLLGLVYTVLGSFALPFLLKPFLAEKLGVALQRSVVIDDIAINPFALSLRLDGLQVREHGQDERVAGLDRLYVNLEAVSLLRGGPVLSELRIEKPYLKIVRLAENRYNHSDLVEKILAQPADSGPTPPFSVSEIRLLAGAVDFDDRLLNEQHRVDEIELVLPFISSLPHYASSYIDPAFSARIDGARFAMQGRSQPFSDSHESELSLTLNDLSLAKYFDYLPLRPALNIDSGTLSGEVRLLFRQENGKTASEKAASLQLSGKLGLDHLRLSRSKDEPLLAVSRVEVDLAGFDLTRRRLAIRDVTIDSPEIDARVDRNGVLNWQALFPPTAETTAPSAGATLHWSLADARVKNGVVRWLDDSRGKTTRASVEGFALHVHELDSAVSAAPGGFDLSGRIRLDDWLEVDTLSLTHGRVQLGKREVQVGDFALLGARASVKRSRDGALEWFEPPLLRVAAAPAGTAVAPSAPWQISAGHLRGADIALRFTDNAVEPAAQQVIDGLGFEIDDLSLAAGAQAKLAARFKLNRNGAVDVRGTLGLSPLAGKLALDLKNMELPAVQPYIGERFNAAVTRGRLALQGDLQWEQSGNSAGLGGRFSGQATVSDFLAVTRPQVSELLRWKSLHFGKVDFQFGAPDASALAIAEVALTDFYARAVIDPAGKLNLLSLARISEKAEKAVPTAEEASKDATKEVAEEVAKELTKDAPAPGKAMPVRVGKMTLQGGNIEFSDLFVKPNFSVTLRHIGGSVQGLSSQAGSVATVDLRGDYDGVAPVKISGRINPLAAEPSLDVEAEIRGVEMTPLSPYAEKYAGYAIEQGKLSFFAKYAVENRKLSAENRIFLDQLTFGSAVASADATKLPVLLILALLKNRRGEVEVELPIAGSLDDPEFSIGGVVLRLLGNLFVKAISSPFALLGSLFGDGEELSFLDFAEGRAILNEAAQKRLDSLAKALLDRPAIRLGIGGRADLERDREGLKKALLEDSLKKLKRDDLLTRGASGATMEEIGIEPSEYPALLARAYRAANFPKPRNLIGLAKDLPLPEMEKLLLSNIAAGDEELQALANRRALAVRDWLLTQRSIPAERMFLQPVRLEGRDRPAEGGRAQGGSRVDFSLK